MFEQEKSPGTASSPDKSVVLPEAGSSNDMEKNEPPQSPSKTSDFTSVGKASTVGGSRKEPKEAGRDGGSLNGGSRNKRRGTVDHVETDSKLGNMTSSKSKGAKEKDKSGKSGGKSAKKVVIDDSREKNGTATASSKRILICFYIVEWFNTMHHTTKFGCILIIMKVDSENSVFNVLTSECSF